MAGLAIVKTLTRETQQMLVILVTMVVGASVPLLLISLLRPILPKDLWASLMLLSMVAGGICVPIVLEEMVFRPRGWFGRQPNPTKQELLQLNDWQFSQWNTLRVTPYESLPDSLRDYLGAVFWEGQLFSDYALADWVRQELTDPTEEE